MQVIIRRIRGFNDIAIPLLFSLFIHFVFIYIIFFPGGGSNNMKSHQLSVSDKLDSADAFILEEVNRTRERVTRKISEINALKREEFKGRWTLENMTERIEKALKRIGIDIKENRVVPSMFEEKDRYSILVRLVTTPRLVFEDILLISYVVGEGTLRSNFTTDYLVLSIKGKNGGEPRDFIVTTMDCRLLYAKKLSAQQFISQAKISEGKKF